MQKQKYVAIAVLLGTTMTTYAVEDITPIIVTATRTAQTADETLASVTVIDRETIETSRSNSILELLQSYTPGIDISRNGGPGSSSNLFLRGSESDHVLVLIDGSRVSSVTSGSFNWASLSTEQIERIEIVRGPNSTLYGSEAIGGVIQIFTRKGTGLQASVTGGSYQTGKASISSGGKVGTGRYHINLSHEQDEGFSTTSPESTRYEEDDDGYRRSSIGAGADFSLSNSTDLAINLLHTSGESDYDDSAYEHAYAEAQNSSAALQLNWQSSDRWSQRFILNASQDRYESHDSWPAEIDTIRRGAGWQSDAIIADSSVITFGLDFQRDHGEIVDSYDETVDNHAAYMQYQWTGEQFDLLLGSRSDKHSEYGRHGTGRLTVGSRVGKGRLYAGYATAFKAPTFNELYYPFYGNLELDPEESRTAEIGYRLGQFQASLYRTRVDNLIQSDPLTWQAVNVGKAKMEGLEVEYTHPVGSWRLHGAATLQKSEDEDTGEALLRRAEKKLLFNATGPLSPRSTLGIEATYTGPRMDYGDVEMSSYTLLNLTSDYALNGQWKLAGRVENLLDEEYELADGYNTAGLSAYLTLSYQQ